MSETCANPLLLEWIKEWLDQARERNSKGAIVYKKAYDSMKACPLVFQHPSEAQQLNGLGPKLCDRLTEKLKAYCEENGLPMPERHQKCEYYYSRPASSKRPSGEGTTESQPAKKPRKAKPYVPSLRSGPYALILALATLDEDSSQGLTKTQLIEIAQPNCDSSFTAPSDTSKFHTAWSSMKTLLQKEFVYDFGRPLKKYALTEEGWEVAKRMKKVASSSDQGTLTFGSQPGPSASNASVSQSQLNASGNSTAVPGPLHQEVLDNDAPQIHRNIQGGEQVDDGTVTPITIPPDSFTVQLVLDVREVRSSKDRDYIANELHKKGVSLDVRALELGDAMWVAKFHNPTFLSQYGEEGDEIMLDWIVERKRLDDLISSMKDGRFHEQKFRLRRSGVKNVIYLIEEFTVTLDANSVMAVKYNEMVASAIASTQVVNGYFVKRTKNLDDTIHYLARMTFLLRRMFNPSPGEIPSNTLSLIPSRQLSSSQSYLNALERLRAEKPSVTYAVTFPTFSTLTSKSDVLILRDVFLKMLMCIRGVTGEKAIEIQRRWQTPQAFIRAYEELDPKARENMVSDRMQTLVGRKKVAKVLSKKIAEVWGEDG
ncbi:crossover junction endonuclease mus81 [Aspergillus sclerotioniger CBS 115572]|uniref:Crossover junction endonuclease MUS81 n=1 Tax=Aspergillus sclerotioniger CBS 115572 TaxID=1450535 RepID=A0A317W5K4_9EURO|nr:crossover junction endonuclease mus81 [Aspergillus sclerotioniger CBS 115572]PWY80328.1 crossover junction endonuclease mus81 [Aspergillus sclerotioniger CBS 115572]